MNSEDNYPPDLAMVPTGTKCGPNMVRSGGRRWNKRPGSVPSLFSCVSGVLQPTVSRHEERKTVRYQRLLEQMQQPWGRKRVLGHLGQLSRSGVTECDLW